MHCFDSSSDIYSEHLSLGLGPIIRIGTPVSDLSLSKLPSPRGIKEEGIHNDEDAHDQMEEDMQNNNIRINRQVRARC